MSDEDLKKQLELKKQELTIQFHRQADVYQSNIAAIDSAIRVIDGQVHIESSEPGKLRDVILDAIKIAPVEFSIRDIARIIALKNPGNPISQQSLAGSFWKIATQELKLPLIKEGAGNQPAIYRKLL
jgi:hypothetical protein